MSYRDLLDSTYDPQFSAVPNLRWIPWIGRRFTKKESGRKLLIIGESHYALAGENESIEAVQEKHEKNKEFTKAIIWECPISEEWKNRTLDNIPRLFVGNANYKRLDFWQDVAFYNFIQRMVHYVKPPERPSWNDFVAGWDVFYEILKIIKPDYCVFLGTEAHHSFGFSMKNQGSEFSDVKRREKIGRCWSYRAVLRIEEKNIPIIFVQHPGKFFSSSALGRPKTLKKVRFSCPEFGPRHEGLISTSLPIRFCAAWPPELRYPDEPESRVSNA